MYSASHRPRDRPQHDPELSPSLAQEIAGPPAARLLEPTATDLRAQQGWPMLRDTITAWRENGFNLVKASAARREHRATMALHLACLADQLGGGNAAGSSQVLP
ncbi:hypothetical protein [Streptomyces sp. NPDC050988]|uniref:hypothetical protein n=1 Tax=Streptomyces sp. NPDC050988 TaxID=3365637 RepID=UPI0037A0737B